MIRSTVLFVVSLASPALLVAIAVDVVRARSGRVVETLAWITATVALLFAVVYPSLVESVGAKLGVSIPGELVGFAAIAGIFVAYVRHRARVTELERKVRELELLDLRAGEASPRQEESPARDRRAPRRRDDSAQA